MADQEFLKKLRNRPSDLQQTQNTIRAEVTTTSNLAQQ